MGTRLRSDRALAQEPVTAGGPPRIRWLPAALVLVSAGVLGACALLAAAHVDDRYKLDHVSGARIALAQYVNEGTLYPELDDGRFYGGTRFMPLPVLLHAAVAKLTGEYLVSGKLLGYAAMAALLGLVFVLLRWMRCPLPIAVALVATIVATRTGWPPPWTCGRTSCRCCCRSWPSRSWPACEGPTATIAAAALPPPPSSASSARSGRPWRSPCGCWPPTGDGWPGSPPRTARSPWRSWSCSSPPATVASSRTSSVCRRPGSRASARCCERPMSSCGCWWSRRRAPGSCFRRWRSRVGSPSRERRPTIWLVSLVCCVGVLLVVLTDVGTGWNQLIDPVVLTVLVVGELAGRRWPDPVAAAVPAIIAIVLLWVNLGGLAVTIAPDLQPALADLRGARHYSPEPLAGRATAATPLLSEDPYVPVSLGQRPVVLDPFMLLRIGRRDPAAAQRLVDRIRARGVRAGRAGGPVAAGGPAVVE